MVYFNYKCECVCSTLQPPCRLAVSTHSKYESVGSKRNEVKLYCFVRPPVGVATSLRLNINISETHQRRKMKLFQGLAARISVFSLVGGQASLIHCDARRRCASHVMDVKEQTKDIHHCDPPGHKNAQKCCEASCLVAIHDTCALDSRRKQTANSWALD